MKITIVDFLSDAVLSAVLSDNIVYRPDLKLRSQSVLLGALQRSTSDALISSTELNLDLFSRWRSGRTKYMVQICVSSDSSQPHTSTKRMEDGFIMAFAAASTQLKALRID